MRLLPRVHPRAPMRSHTLLLQGYKSIHPDAAPAKSHAGTSLGPPSSCLYPLRLSGFRKTEGLNSFKEKQVQRDPRQLSPHLPILPRVCSCGHFLNAQHLRTIVTTQPLMGVVGGGTWQSRGGPERWPSFSSLLWGLTIHTLVFHATSFSEHLLSLHRPARHAGDPRTSPPCL